MARVMEDSAHNDNAKLLFETHKGSDGAHVVQVDATLATRKAQISAADMATLKSRLPSELSARCPDQMINQFLRATDSNISQAEKRLRETLQWREAENVECITCLACTRDPRSHYMHPIGIDRWGRPVIYSCLALAANRSVEDNRLHMVATFEQAIKLMKPPVEQWVWVSDFHGFGFGDLNPQIANTFLELSSKHYPERLGAFMVVGAPFIFNGLWSVLQPLVDSVTRRKIHMLSYDVQKGSALNQTFADFFEPELATWLLTEMEQNRNKTLAAGKAYPYGKLFDSCARTTVQGHDLRGTSEMLKAVKLQQS
ncbi:g11032 [Coccomyxa elongata]